MLNRYLPSFLYELIYKENPALTRNQLYFIKICFDVSETQEVTRETVAKRLLLLEGKPVVIDESIKNRVDNNVKKIRDYILGRFDNEPLDFSSELRKQFKIHHITDVFKTYAYFGLYEREKSTYISQLSKILNK